MQSAGIDLVTTEPAAMIERGPICTPLQIMQRQPIKQLSPIVTGLLIAFDTPSILSDLSFQSRLWKFESKIKQPAPIST